MPSFASIQEEIASMLDVPDEELTDEQQKLMDEYLDELGQQEAAKVDAFAGFIRKQSTIADAMKNEADHLAAKARAARNRIDYLKRHYLAVTMAYIQCLREKQCTPEYLEYHMYAIKPVLKRFGTMPITEMNIILVNEVLEMYRRDSVRGTILRHMICVFRMVMLWCVRNGFCQNISFPLPKADYEKFIPLTPEELAVMFQAAHAHIQRVIISGSQCGVRIGDCELFKLTWQDVNFEQGILNVHGSRKNRNAPWGEVPLHQNLIPVLREWRDSDQASGITHIINFNGKPVKSIKRTWQAMLKKAGITRRIRPYDLRHAFATELIAAGTDIGTVAKLMAI